MRIETSEINATRLDILSGPGTRQLVDGVRERLRSDKPRCIAIGRCVNGGSFTVIAPQVPVDWPTAEEVDAIIAACPPKPFTEADELEERAEERREQ